MHLLADSYEFRAAVVKVLREVQSALQCKAAAKVTTKAGATGSGGRAFVSEDEDDDDDDDDVAFVQVRKLKCEHGVRDSVPVVLGGVYHCS